MKYVIISRNVDSPEGTVVSESDEPYTIDELYEVLNSYHESELAKFAAATLFRCEWINIGDRSNTTYEIEER